MYALRAPAVQGQAYPLEAVGEVQEGMSASDVLALLGEPLVRRPDGAVGLWYYYAFEATRACDVYLLGVVRVKKAPSFTAETEVVFESGTVASVKSRRRTGYRKPKYSIGTTEPFLAP